MLNTTQNADVLPENYDFLGQIMNAPGVISVAKDSGITLVDDLIAEAESGEVTISNSGAGSIWEAASLGFADAAGIDVSPGAVRRRRSCRERCGLRRGRRIGLGCRARRSRRRTPSRSSPSWTRSRFPTSATCPTANEELGTEDVVFGGWGGMYAPTGLPDAVHSALEDAVKDRRRERLVHRVPEGRRQPRRLPQRRRAPDSSWRSSSSGSRSSSVEDRRRGRRDGRGRRASSVPGARDHGGGGRRRVHAPATSALATQVASAGRVRRRRDGRADLADGARRGRSLGLASCCSSSPITRPAPTARRSGEHRDAAARSASS